MMRYAARTSALLLALATGAAPAAAQTGQGGIGGISLDSLLNVDVSTAARYAQKVRQAPASMTVITHEDIAHYGYRTLADVLDRVRGFYTSDDRNYTYVGIRGFSRPTDYNNRVLLLLDGQPLNEGMYGSAPIGTELALGLDAVERIEIARGPASALYGTSAMLGVVNIVTKRGAGPMRTEVAGEAGSHGMRTGRATVTGTVAGGTDVLVTASHTRTDGENVHFAAFDDGDGDGMARGLDWDRGSHGLVTMRRGGLSAHAWYGEREKAIPTAPWDAIFNASGTTTFDAQASARIRWQHTPLRDVRLDASASWAYYAYRGAYVQDGGTTVDSTDTRRAALGAQVIWDVAPEHRLSAGATWERNYRVDYRGWFEGEPWFLDDFPFSVAGFYAQHEATFSHVLTLTTGLRHDRLQGMPGATTPRLALIWSPSRRRTVKLLYGEAFRSPNTHERFYQDSEFKRPENLRREHVRTFEAVWEERLARWLRAEVAAYHYRIADLIDTDVDPADGFGHFVNRDEVAAPGLEMELEARLPAGPSAWLSWAWQHARDVDTRGRLTNSPGHIVKAGISTPVGGMIRLSAEAFRESERLTLAGARTDAALVVRSGIRIEPSDDVSVWFAADNLLDAAHSVPGGFEHAQDALPQARRTLRGGLAFRF